MQMTKPVRCGTFEEVTYGKEHWTLLEETRDRAKQIMTVFEKSNLRTIVHGSLARGDVNKNSDIDIHLSEPVSSFTVETSLDKAQMRVNSRLIIQATPTYAMKAYIEIDPRINVSFSLMRLRKVEREFYRFGGEASFNQLMMDIRVPGVDKRLMLIEPTDKGHIESSIIGCEEQTAGILRISANTVRNRVRALLKRDKVGRTGLFIKRSLEADETFEMAVKRLADENPALRRKIKQMTR
jgi:uncharacterized protein